MKYCPRCKTRYVDDTLQFCLEDGNKLLDFLDSSLTMPEQALDEAETFVRQKQIPIVLEQSQGTQATTLQPETKKSNVPTAIILTAIVICVLFASGMGIWFLISKGNSEVSGLSNTYTNNASPSPNPILIRTPSNTSADFTSMMDNITFQGDILTYYRGTTAAQCQSDCLARGSHCQAFTFVRASAYGQGNPEMCYLIMRITNELSNSCCISGKRR